MATFTVTLSAAQATNLTFSYATTSGTATGGITCTTGVDYLSQAGPKTILAGQLTTTIPITTCNDAVVELTEGFTVTISSPSIPTVIITTGTGTGTIYDNDVPLATLRRQIKGKVQMAGKIYVGHGVVGQQSEF